jgi:hypothetical protein
MTEHQWLFCADPQVMLEWLHQQGTLSERKARLFAVACCRRVWRLFDDEWFQRAVEVAEQYADDLVTAAEMAGVRNALAENADNSRRISYFHWAALAVMSNTEPNIHAHGKHYRAWRVGGGFAAALTTADYTRIGAVFAGKVHEEAEGAAQATLLRELVGPLPFRDHRLSPSILRWNSGIVVNLAEAAYQERSLPAGTLDPARLAILADALEEAGADDGSLLQHLRSPGPHVHGCFAVDAVLGRA